ncbi:hypothetical protein ACFSFY_12700 [Sporosarcina siberiensis]|uniref:tRNA (Uracil-5-)-methyltransferase n=1 Tax=Sporosarcina siberiensis TaxID=1365606 RepID=A0ABW4SH76_9BACL
MIGEKIIYISCNPETQARDLALLVEHGYQVKGIQPVEIFPQTNYIETGNRPTRNNTTIKKAYTSFLCFVSRGSRGGLFIIIFVIRTF